MTPPAPQSVGLPGEVLGATTRYVFLRNLSFGMTAPDVKELQKRMIEEGTYSGDVTGYYGRLTSLAVKEYQSRHGIPQTGNMGPKTRSALNEEGSVLGESTVSTSGTVLTQEERVSRIKQLLERVLELQKQLLALKAGKKKEKKKGA